jgi:hypothetical protein
MSLSPPESKATVGIFPCERVHFGAVGVKYRPLPGSKFVNPPTRFPVDGAK